MASWRDVEKTVSPLVRKLHDYWQSKRAGRALPDRADIDPAEFKALLPCIIMAESSEQPFRIRYRLLGTRVVAVSGFDFTWHYLDELQAADIDDHWHDYYREARDARAPVFGSVTVPTIHGGQFSYEFGIFPLTNGGGAVARFIAIEDYGPSEPRLAELFPKVTHWRPRATEG